ncbi:hypothetical protein RZS08_58045, partial [Arthrospira platensis SPKY1]|nr:hypothetical protein [Arthrospira platensis SPKY1]
DGRHPILLQPRPETAQIGGGQFTPAPVRRQFQAQVQIASAPFAHPRRQVDRQGANDDIAGLNRLGIEMGEPRLHGEAFLGGPLQRAGMAGDEEGGHRFTARSGQQPPEQLVKKGPQ